MTYKEIRDQFILNLRLDYDPVGIKYIYNNKDLENLPITHNAKMKLAFCQYLAAVRQTRYSLFIAPDRILCENGKLILGFRDLVPESEIKYHKKYFKDENLALESVVQKAKLEKGCKGIFVAPIDAFDNTTFAPDIVFFVLTVFQAYHILNDYMGATNKPNLNFFHTPNSAVCSGSIWAFQNNTANMTTMCSGSKTSGKTEMGNVNLFIPGNKIKETAIYQKNRIAEGSGASLVGKGSAPWPGLDVCSGCPMVKFEKVVDKK